MKELYYKLSYHGTGFGEKVYVRIMFRTESAVARFNELPPEEAILPLAARIKDWADRWPIKYRIGAGMVRRLSRNMSLIQAQEIALHAITLDLRLRKLAEASQKWFEASQKWFEDLTYVEGLLK